MRLVRTRRRILFVAAVTVASIVGWTLLSSGRGSRFVGRWESFIAVRNSRGDLPKRQLHSAFPVETFMQVQDGRLELKADGTGVWIPDDSNEPPRFFDWWSDGRRYLTLRTKRTPLDRLQLAIDDFWSQIRGDGPSKLGRFIIREGSADRVVIQQSDDSPTAFILRRASM